MKTKETNPTRPGSPTPCKQALSYGKCSCNKNQCIVPCKVIQNQFWDAKIFCTGFCGLQGTRLSVPVLLDWILECSILDFRAEMLEED